MAHTSNRGAIVFYSNYFWLYNSNNNNAICIFSYTILVIKK